MTRWMVGAALAAGPFLLCPLEATAQGNVAFSCEYGPNFSYVIIKNLRPKRSNCTWDCVYEITPGKYHMNRGARFLRPGQQLGMDKTKKVAPGIARRGGGSASCLDKL